MEGTGGIETLQANDVKVTGLGVNYVETYLNAKNVSSATAEDKASETPNDAQ